MYKTYRHHSTQEADETLNHLLDVIVEGTWDWDANTGHVDRSPGWYRMLGYEVGVFQKNVFTWENVIHPEDYDRVMKHFELYTSGKIDRYCIEYRCKKADGEYLWIVDRGKVVKYNADGSVARMIGAHLNIHEQKMAQNELIKKNQLLKEGNVSLEKIIRKKADELERKNQELEEKIKEVEYISNMDPLTEIANRKKFETELEKEISRSKRYGHPLSLVIFDIDFFKQVNDTLGHKTGDTVLQKLCQLVKQNIREVDFFARWGGEEFSIIFPGLAFESALSATEKLRMLVSDYQFGQNLSVTCSFGVSKYLKGDSVDVLFRRADEALYRAKELGRNRVEGLVDNDNIGRS